MQSTRILLLTVGAAVLYGVVHDQFTARICLEYFTVAHPPRITSQSPTIVGLYWGFAATAWIGALLGVLLSLAARAGERPRLCWRDLVRPLAWLFVTMGLVAALAGTTGYWLTSAGRVSIGEWGDVFPPERHARFAAALASHLASYVSGILGGIAIVVWVISRRHRTP